MEGVAVVGDSDGVRVAGLKAFWAAVGGSGWLKNKQRCCRRGICYSFFCFLRIVETVRVIYLRFCMA